MQQCQSIVTPVQHMVQSVSYLLHLERYVKNLTHSANRNDHAYTILFAHVLRYYFARVYLSLAVKRRSRHHLPNGQVASANFVFNFIMHPHCPHTLIGLINSGHSRQILKRSLATFLVTLGEPSMRFQGRTSPESSDILVFYTILASVSRRTYHPWSRAVLMA